MVLVPFIYFFSLTIFFWKKHGCFDICVMMTTLYTVTSLCAIPLVFGEMLVGEGGILYGNTDLNLGFVPTVLYCVLITISILPFTIFHKKDFKTITPITPFVLEVVSLFIIGVSMLNLYLVADSTVEILSGDLSTVRSDHYEGILSPADVKALSMPAIFKVIYYFRAATILALPIMFYHICFDSKPFWYIFLLFFASISSPIAGIQCADRTEVVYYGLMFLFCLLFFGNYISNKFKRIMWSLGIPIGLSFIVYFIAVSDARFNTDDGKGSAAESILQYAGQSYLNFCYFWECSKSDNISTEREFPLYNHYVKKVDSNKEQRAKRSGKHGFFISVFPSFVGDIMLDLGVLGVLIWVMVFHLVTLLIIKRPHRESFNVGEMLGIFFMAGVPIFGIFYYRYYSFNHSLILLMVLFIYFFSKYRLVYK